MKIYFKVWLLVITTIFIPSILNSQPESWYTEITCNDLYKITHHHLIKNLDPEDTVSGIHVRHLEEDQDGYLAYVNLDVTRHFHYQDAYQIRLNRVGELVSLKHTRFNPPAAIIRTSLDRLVLFEAWDKVWAINNSGETQWKININRPSESRAISMLGTPDGGVIFLFCKNRFSDHYLVLIKLDFDGGVAWEKMIPFEGTEISLTMASMREGACAILMSLPAQGGDIENYLLKIDGEGKEIGKTKLPIESYFEATDLLQTGEGGWFLTGQMDRKNAALFKIDVDGKIQFLKVFRKGIHSEIRQIVKDQTGYLLLGHFNSRSEPNHDHFVWLTKISEQGLTFFDAKYSILGSSNKSWEFVMPTSDQGYLLAVGYEEDFDKSLAFIKLDSLGLVHDDDYASRVAIENVKRSVETVTYYGLEAPLGIFIWIITAGDPMP